MCDVAQVSGNTPGRNIALALCTDGVQPVKKGGRGYWPIAIQCLNLPPWLRHKMTAMMLCCVLSNTSASADLQPTLEIIVDELNWLYHKGINVSDAHHGDEVHIRAMLIDVRSDFPGTSKGFRYTGGGAFVGACYGCCQEGVCCQKRKRIYPGVLQAAVCCSSVPLLMCAASMHAQQAACMLSASVPLLACAAIAHDCKLLCAVCQCCRVHADAMC